MELSQQKQQLSLAYVQAVAATVGLAHAVWSVDEDSIDLSLGMRGGRGTIRSPKVDLQLKCSSRDLLRPEALHFPLKIKNYDDLRYTEETVPRILVVVIVPESVDDWLLHSEEQMIIRHCGYWMSLHGAPPVQNSRSVSVKLPRTNKFDVEGLTAMMGRISRRELP